MSDINFRVFSDRLIDAGDHEAFVSLLSDKLGTMFDLTFHNLCPNKQPPIFGKLINNCLPKWRWRGKYPPVATDTEVNSCFSVY